MPDNLAFTRSVRDHLTLAALLLFFGMVLAGCGKKYSDAEATAAVAPETITNQTQWAAPEQFQDDENAPAVDTGRVRDDWIRNFDDSVLDELVKEAEANNPDIHTAIARVEQSQAMAAQAYSALLPTIGVGAQYAGVSRNDYARPPSGVGLGVSWEADVWGRVGLTAQAAEEAARATQDDYEFARQSLAAATARSWYLVCETQLQLNFLKEIVGIVKRMEDIVKIREEVGRVSMMDVSQIRAQVSSIQGAAVQAEMAHQQAVRSLEVLLGRYPAGKVKAVDSLDVNLDPIPVGQPSDILSRRPDLQAAERRVAAAFYAEKSAELLRLPSFTIQTGGGVTGLGNAIVGLAAGVFAPLYTGGRIEAEMAQATAEQKEAVAMYGGAALKAFQEVENALAGERFLALRRDFLDVAAAENKKAFDYAEEQLRIGRMDMFEVLELQTRWIGSEITLLDVEREQIDNRINLHLALGGSFEESKPAETQAETPAPDASGR